MRRLGIDIGTGTIQIAILDGDRVVELLQCKHCGSVKQELLEMLAQLQTIFFDEVLQIGITGQGARTLQKIIPQISWVEEIPAITKGALYLEPEAASVIEVGCQNARYITGITDALPQFSMNEHCAGGTGSFFEAQVSRLGVDIEQYSDLISHAKTIPNMSGRCAVFAKSDMIHRQQEQIPTADILLGLCYAMVRNFKAVIMGQFPLTKPVVFCGGVASNMGVVQAFRDVLHLAADELRIPKHYAYAGALGAAELADKVTSIPELIQFLQMNSIEADTLSRLPQLYGEPQAFMQAEPWPNALPEDGVYLGIDIGSTSTNLVLADTKQKLIGYQYLRTGGNPLRAVQEGLAALRERYGEQLPVLGVGVTGSGRERIGAMINADVVRDEITAQARAAAYASPQADTVFEIGGQDSKYISLKNGQVAQFQMNKICAAGTGAFIEEQAAQMQIAIDAFGPTAITAKHPVDLGDRCTVFIETAIASAQAQGAKQEELAAGLCYSIVQNYLNKVVGTRPVGEYIVLQGGVAYNPGIVAAFRHHFGERLHVSPVFAVSGAFGVALLAKEQLEQSRCGLDNRQPIDSRFRSISFDTRQKTKKFVEKETGKQQQPKNLLLQHYSPKRDPQKKTVGVPYALMIHKFFPMANTFFKELGFNVLLSSASNETTIARAQSLARSETCYPVKLIYGHVQELVEQDVDYIFMPSVRTLRHETSHVENNYGCVYMQTAPKLVYDAMGLEEKGIVLLNPVFDLDFGQQAMAMSMVAMGEALGFSRQQCMKAMQSGAMAVQQYTADVEAQGKLMLEQLESNDKVLVLITRNYGVNDPILNMGIPRMLRERGYKVMMLSHLPAHDLDLHADHPHLCWPFGQHILSGAKIIKNHPNLYAVYLTNHGCGPDTMISHLFREEMGDKPYLHIEVDEHFSHVGVVTRIEAFLNSLSKRPTEKLSADFRLKNVTTTDIQLHDELKQDKPVLIPQIGVYSDLLTQYYAENGQAAYVISAGTDEMKLGTAETYSKEYAAFTLLLGAAQKANTQYTTGQILIPHTEGAEADNQYGRVIDAILREKSKTDKQNLTIYAPSLERIPIYTHKLDTLFRLLLAGDLYYAAVPKVREQISFSAVPSILELMDLAVFVQQQNEKAGVTEYAVSVLGDPVCVYAIAEPILTRLETENNYRLRYMPISEYLLYLWKFTAETEKERVILHSCEALLCQISRALGQYSPFSEQLLQAEITNAQMSRFAGGNGTYRFMKLQQEAKQSKGILSIASQYENTEMILSMMPELKHIPIHHMDVGNRWENSDWERLYAFLYYVKQSMSH